jgi:hypothetical protein
MKAVVTIFSLLISLSSFGQIYKGKSEDKFHNCEFKINDDSTVILVFSDDDRSHHLYDSYNELWGVIKRINDTTFSIATQSDLFIGINMARKRDSLIIWDKAGIVTLDKLILTQKNGQKIHLNNKQISIYASTLSIYLKNRTYINVDIGQIDPISNKPVIFDLDHRSNLSVEKHSGKKNYLVIMRSNSLIVRRPDKPVKERDYLLNKTPK